jgi:hypothetical protein
MENTLGNKAKFFALYWGQNVHNGLNSGGEEFQVAQINRFIIQYMENTFLKLKPLSSISAEDAIEVGRILKIDFKPQYLINEVREWIDCRFGFGRIEHRFECFEILDYLRSKGYALPFMGVGVETLVSWGWVKLHDSKEQKQS